MAQCPRNDAHATTFDTVVVSVTYLLALHLPVHPGVYFIRLSQQNMYLNTEIPVPKDAGSGVTKLEVKVMCKYREEIQPALQKQWDTIVSLNNWQLVLHKVSSPSEYFPTWFLSDRDRTHGSPTSLCLRSLCRLVGADPEKLRRGSQVGIKGTYNIITTLQFNYYR